MPVWSDKLLAEVMRMILDAYFDGTFSDHSHGFRADRGCHTALREIYRTWTGTTWIIEGDIADCFGSLDHNLIISALAEHIQDGRFLNLVKKLLDAGYMDNWTFNKTLSGVPFFLVCVGHIEKLITQTEKRNGHGCCQQPSGAHTCPVLVPIECIQRA
jgi:retron-type reverse transcriptase